LTQARQRICADAVLSVIAVVGLAGLAEVRHKFLNTLLNQASMPSGAG
jgi:hypothetical protein